MDILDDYVYEAPSDQAAIDIFKGQWSCAVPGLISGQVDVFDDPRIHWAVSQFGSLENRNVLELGPLEAAHTYMLEKVYGAHVVAVEANKRSYLKCLIVKEVLRLTRSRFLLGDFLEYLENCGNRVDAVIASGVLYHSLNPMRLLHLISTVTDKVLLWTHYFDPDMRRELLADFKGSETSHYDGLAYTRHRREYGRALDWGGFCGGGAPYSFWLSRTTILDALAHFGLREVAIAFDHPGHPNGPAFCLAACR